MSEPSPGRTRAAADREGPSLPRWSLRNRRVRTRLVALIAVPTVVAIALGAVVIVTTLTSAAAYGRTEALAALARSATATTAALQNEQAGAAAFVGAGRPAARAEALADARAHTDAESGRMRRDAAAVDDGYADSTRDRVRRAMFRLDTLPALRSAVTADRLPAGVTVDKYSSVITDLIAVDDEISQDTGDPVLSASVRALGSLSRAKAALAVQHGLLESALLAGRFEPGGFDALNGAAAAQEGAEDLFRVSATVGQAQSYDDVVAGADVDDTSALLSGVQSAGGATPGGAPAAATWDAAANGTVDKLRAVETGLIDSIAEQAGALRAERIQQAVIAAIVAALVVLAVLATTIAVARSLVRPLRALRNGALSVAEDRLPDVVSRLGSEDPETVDTRVQPIAVYSTDEIGEVARSFDEVHREAIRLAGAEAQRRAQTGALFVNLSRRTQSLVDRQIELIDDLEQGEDDPDRLGNLFALDHLATRMRRNGENLLVLGGQEPMRRWHEVLPLLDVLRAAISEVEQYERVDLAPVPALFVTRDAVSDVVHLLSELLDNATTFSARTSRVSVAATGLPDGSAFVEITDRGIGLSAEECAELDTRLAEPTEIDASVSRRMGLYVVARLAARQNVRVRLHPAQPRGVVAAVTLPAAALTTWRTTDPEPAGVGAEAAAAPADGAWIGERWSRAVATPGPGPDSWFGGAPLAPDAENGSAEPPTPAIGMPVVSGTGGDARHRRESDPGAPAPDRSFGGTAAGFTPTASGTTSAGLPQRSPGANTVPGALPPGAAPPEDTAAPMSSRRPSPRPRGNADAPTGAAATAGAVAGATATAAAAAASGAGTGEPAGADRDSGAPDTGAPDAGAPDAGADGWGASDRSPDSVRNRYAGFQRGRAQGRTVAGGPEQPGTWIPPAVRKPTAAGTAASGLPLRDPGANYVPGAVPDDPADQDGRPAARAAEDPAAPPSEWDRSAEAIRRRFAAHQEGRRRGMETNR